MTERATLLTEEGLQKLLEELEYLRTVRRQEVAQRLHDAMEGGDIQENAEYEDAKNERAFVEGRIMTLESMLKNIEIIASSGANDTVRLGNRVTVVEINDEVEEPETYHVVGSAEADPVEGRISNESPLGRGLMGRSVGDTVTVNAPRGVLKFKIVEIE